MPRRVGRYTLGSVIASSSGSEVYLCTAAGSDEALVAKAVPMDDAISERQRSGVLREAGILRQISHPHIVSLKDVLRTKHHIYLIFEYAGSGTLEGKIPISERVARVYVRQLVCALAYLHRHNIMHRDIKPSNILVRADRKCVQLSDLGFARVIAQCATTRLGTPAYVAPEVIDCRTGSGSTPADGRGSGYSFSADIWSLGVTLFELLSGSLPFGSRDVQTLYAQIARGVYTVPSHISSEAGSLLRLMLTNNPSARATVADVASHPWVLEGVTPAEFSAISDSLAGGVRKRPCLSQACAPVGPLVVDTAECGGVEAFSEWFDVRERRTSGPVAQSTTVYDALPPPALPPRSAIYLPQLIETVVVDFSVVPPSSWLSVCHYVVECVLRSALCLKRKSSTPDVDDDVTEGLELTTKLDMASVEAACASGSAAGVVKAIASVWDAGVRAACAICEVEAPLSCDASAAGSVPKAAAAAGVSGDGAAEGSSDTVQSAVPAVSAFPSAVCGGIPGEAWGAGQSFVHNAVQLITAGETAALVYPCVTGGHLAALVPFALHSLCPHLRQVVGGLAFLHSRGVPMRHLSPYTLHVTADRRAVLLYGPSRLVKPAGDSTVCSAYDGYSNFVAPEVLLVCLTPSWCVEVCANPLSRVNSGPDQREAVESEEGPGSDEQPAEPTEGVERKSSGIAKVDAIGVVSHPAGISPVQSAQPAEGMGPSNMSMGSGNVFAAADAVVCPYAADIWSLGMTFAALLGVAGPSPWAVLLRLAETEAGTAVPSEALSDLTSPTGDLRSEVMSVESYGRGSALVETASGVGADASDAPPPLVRCIARRLPHLAELPTVVADAVCSLLSPSRHEATLRAVAVEVASDTLRQLRSILTRAVMSVTAHATSTGSPVPPRGGAVAMSDVDAAVSLVGRMLEPSPTSRATLAEVLRDPLLQTGAGRVAVSRLQLVSEKVASITAARKQAAVEAAAAATASADGPPPPTSTSVSPRRTAPEAMSISTPISFQGGKFRISGNP